MNTVGAWDFYTQRWGINKQNKKCANALPEFRWSSQNCGETKIEFRDVSYAWPLTHLSSRQGHFQGDLILSHSDIMLSSCWKFICDISVQHKLVLRGCLFLWSLKFDSRCNSILTISPEFLILCSCYYALAVGDYSARTCP